MFDTNLYFISDESKWPLWMILITIQPSPSAYLWYIDLNISQYLLSNTPLSKHNHAASMAASQPAQRSIDGPVAPSVTVSAAATLKHFFPTVQFSCCSDPRVMAARGGASFLNSLSVCFPHESPNETLGILQPTEAY